MFGLLQNFEQSAGRFSPVVLIGLGIILVLAGLFVWLGGLGLTRILAGVVGAVAGAVCGFFVIRRTIASAVFLATVMTAVAVIFERIFFIILTAALALVVSFAVLAWPYLGIPRQLPAANQISATVHGPAMSATETVEAAKDCFVNLNSALKLIYSRMPLYKWVIMVGLTVTFFFIGFYSWRLVVSLSCATVGTMLVFAGMVLLLLYKGSFPISGICSKTPFYGSIFLVMTAAGTIEQLLLCRRVVKRSTKRKKSNGDREGPDRTKHSWRTT
jgi:hypothetical protein